MCAVAPKELVARTAFASIQHHRKSATHNSSICFILPFLITEFRLSQILLQILEHGSSMRRAQEDRQGNKRAEADVCV
jgi:hypothetical protein